MVDISDVANLENASLSQLSPELIAALGMDAFAGAEDSEPLSTTGDIASLAALLQDLDLSQLEEDVTCTLEELRDMDRAARLKRLKACGLSLKHQQAVATGIAKAEREGRLVAPTGSKAPTGGRECSTSQVYDEIWLAPGQELRIFAMSDVHTDHTQNFEWVEAHTPGRRANSFDVLLCPGDVSDNHETVRKTLGALKRRFNEVLFTSGNHDVWMPRGSRRRQQEEADPEKATAPPLTSLDVLEQLYALCTELRVRTRPLWVHAPPASGDPPAASSDARSRDVLLLPMQSWYHQAWDKEPPRPGDEGEVGYQQMFMDFSCCAFPPGLENGSDELAEHFASLNEPWMAPLLEQLPPRCRQGRPPPERYTKSQARSRAPDRTRVHCWALLAR